VYKVLKAKYFPRSDFINASIGHNPSYTWRSIMAAQNLVKEGIRWRISNGANVRVWMDKWLPVPSTYKVTSPRLFMHEDTRVQELIVTSTVSWKKSIVDTLFLPHEAEAIKGIPISSRFPVDKLIWTETQNGIFSVRSAYKLAMKMAVNGVRGGSSDSSSLRHFWKRIWSLSIPHKVRHFGWRACREALPTKRNLMKRKVILEDMCEICNEASETTRHVLWSCSKAQEVWGCSKVTVRVARTEGVSFLDIIWQLLMIDEGSDEAAARVITIAWALWNNRNKMRNGGERKSGQGLVQWAMEYLAEYGAAMELTNSVGPVVELPVKWTPPREGWFKINVDGAIFSKQKSAGIGC